MLDQILPYCCAVQITKKPLLELPYARHAAFRQVDRAILYRAKSAWFIPHCVARDIPFAAYVDDHLEDTPAWQSSCLTAFADLLVFSSDHVRDNWRGCFADIGFAAETDSTVIPPYPLTWGSVTETRRVEARQTISRALGRNLGEARLICGTVPIGMRHGTEIFAQAAGIAAGLAPDTVFVWIGDGLNHQEIGYGIYFDYQLRQPWTDSPAGNLFLLPDGPLYSNLLAAADAIFLSSRLGPLPHAAFDALQYGCHVVCFEGASGLADSRYRSSGRIGAHPMPTLSLQRRRCWPCPAKRAKHRRRSRPCRHPSSPGSTSPFATACRGSATSCWERARSTTIRVDNGPEYISGKLVEWAEKRKIALTYIQPGKPQQNAYVERYNRTVRHEWLDLYIFETIEEVQEIATEWLWIYNNERPNMGIGGITPAMKLKMAA